MNCIAHADIDAVSTCGRCGAGLCQECALGTQYQIENKPLCKKCNYDIGCENDRFFKSVLRSKQIRMGIFIGTCAIGLVVFAAFKLKGSGTASAVVSMLFFWGLGFIGNFFEKTPDTRSVKAQAKDAFLEVKYPVSTLVGKILGFFICAVSSPIQILTLLFGIITVKKQLAENAAIMNGFKAENSVQ